MQAVLATIRTSITLSNAPERMIISLFCCIRFHISSIHFERMPPIQLPVVFMSAWSPLGSMSASALSASALGSSLDICELRFSLLRCSFLPIHRYISWINCSRSSLFFSFSPWSDFRMAFSSMASFSFSSAASCCALAYWSVKTARRSCKTKKAPKIITKWKNMLGSHLVS